MNQCIKVEFFLVLTNNLKEEINSSGMKSPTANRTGETSRNNENSRISQMERNLQFKSVRSWSLIQTKNGNLLPVENNLLGSHTCSKVESKCRWEYRGRADECHKHAQPEPQQYPSSHFTLLCTGRRYCCPPEKSVLQHSSTEQRAGARRCVSPTHRKQASTPWHCCAGRRQA